MQLGMGGATENSDPVSGGGVVKGLVGPWKEHGVLFHLVPIQLFLNWLFAGGVNLMNPQTLDRELANYGPGAKCGPPVAFVNKVLLVHACIHSCAFYLWLLLCYNSRGE